MKKQENGGEGNREADRRYREGVSKTVKNTSSDERAEKARDVSRDDLRKARKAEEKGKSRAKT